MWTRALLKQNAKQALRGRYWRAFLVCMVAMLLGAGTNSSAVSLSAQGTYGETSSLINGGEPEVWTGNNAEPELESLLNSVPAWMWGMALAGALVGTVIAVCWTAFLGNPLAVGRCRFFMENRQSPSPFGTMWTVFRKPYLNIVKVHFLVDLKIIAGYILLVVPGVYWSYCYRQVPYLLAENPYMTTGRAMELSREMMLGEKWRSFVLDLSFIGWYFLGSLLLGIGVLFVAPYYEATCAELYAALRSKAFAVGMSDANELSGFVRHDMNP